MESVTSYLCLVLTVAWIDRSTNCSWLQGCFWWGCHQTSSDQKSLQAIQGQVAGDVWSQKDRETTSANCSSKGTRSQGCCLCTTKNNYFQAGSAHRTQVHHNTEHPEKETEAEKTLLQAGASRSNRRPKSKQCQCVPNFCKTVKGKGGWSEWLLPTKVGFTPVIPTPSVTTWSGLLQEQNAPKLRGDPWVQRKPWQFHFLTGRVWFIAIGWSMKEPPPPMLWWPNLFTVFVNKVGLVNSLFVFIFRAFNHAWPDSVSTTQSIVFMQAIRTSWYHLVKVELRTFELSEMDPYVGGGPRDLNFGSLTQNNKVQTILGGGGTRGGDGGYPETEVQPKLTKSKRGGSGAVQFQNPHPRILGLSTQESKSPKLSRILGCSLESSRMKMLFDLHSGMLRIVKFSDSRV